MRIARIAVAGLTAAALFLGGGASAFCTPAPRGAMECCKPAKAKSCAPGMKGADCCRVAPASGGPAPAAVETILPGKTSRDEMKADVSVEAAFSGLPAKEVSPEASPPPLPIRSSSVPLYILNTSILR